MRKCPENRPRPGSQGASRQRPLRLACDVLARLPSAWLDSLVGHGRLIVPLTNSDLSGGFLLIERSARALHRYSARHVARVAIIACVGDAIKNLRIVSVKPSCDRAALSDRCDARTSRMIRAGSLAKDGGYQPPRMGMRVRVS